MIHEYLVLCEWLSASSSLRYIIEIILVDGCEQKTEFRAYSQPGFTVLLRVDFLLPGKQYFMIILEESNNNLT